MEVRQPTRDLISRGPNQGNHWPKTGHSKKNQQQYKSGLNSLLNKFQFNHDFNRASTWWQEPFCREVFGPGWLQHSHSVARCWGHSRWRSAPPPSGPSSPANTWWSTQTKHPESQNNQSVQYIHNNTCHSTMNRKGVVVWPLIGATIHGHYRSTLETFDIITMTTPKGRAGVEMIYELCWFSQYTRLTYHVYIMYTF